MDPGALALAALFLFGKKGKGGRAETPADARVDGARLVARANVASARPWVDTFKQADAPNYLAEGLSRWAGIESGGNATAISKIGERGLLQVTKTSALKEGAVTPVQWDAMIRPTTTREAHARIAMDLANWCWRRAVNLIENPPTSMSDALWYAKLYHSRPADLKGAGLQGPAMPMALMLAERWKNDPKKMHRLRVANVVAFGTPEPAQLRVATK